VLICENTIVEAGGSSDNLDELAPSGTSARNETKLDDEIILIDEARPEDTAAKQMKSHRTLQFIERILKKNSSLVDSATSRLGEPVHLGMQVLALKDRERHKWKLAKIKRIVHATSTTHTVAGVRPKFDSSQGNNQAYEQFVASCHYRVVFDDEDQSESECDAAGNIILPKPSSSDTNINSEIFLNVGSFYSCFKV
jgi:hypothetical protein